MRRLPEWAKTILGIVAILAVGMAFSAIFLPSGKGSRAEAQSLSASQSSVLEVQPAVARAPQAAAVKTEPKAEPTKIPNPAKPPKKKEGVSISGCLSSYGEVGQCIPAGWPGKDGTPHPVTCKDVADLFPKGFRASKEDPANLDKNNDGIACGEKD